VGTKNTSGLWSTVDALDLKIPQNRILSSTTPKKIFYEPVLSNIIYF